MPLFAGVVREAFLTEMILERDANRCKRMNQSPLGRPCQREEQEGLKARGRGMPGLLQEEQEGPG